MSSTTPSKTRKLSLLAAAGLMLASVGQITTVHASDAGYGGVVRTNAEGRDRCRALDASGRPYWKAKVSGRFDDYEDNLIRDRFHVRSCFASKVQCSTFVNRIENRIYPVDQITYRRCTYVG